LKKYIKKVYKKREKNKNIQSLTKNNDSTKINYYNEERYRERERERERERASERFE